MAALRYFHRISDSQWKHMQDAGMTWDDVNKMFKQPSWCSYPGAVDPMGCWSLIDRSIKKRADCKDCDLYTPKAR